MTLALALALALAPAPALTLTRRASAFAAPTPPLAPPPPTHHDYLEPAILSGAGGGDGNLPVARARVHQDGEAKGGEPRRGRAAGRDR